MMGRAERTLPNKPAPCRQQPRHREIFLSPSSSSSKRKRCKLTADALRIDFPIPWRAYQKYIMPACCRNFKCSLCFALSFDSAKWRANVDTTGSVLPLSAGRTTFLRQRMGKMICNILTPYTLIAGTTAASLAFSSAV